MRRYELMLVVRPDVPEDRVQAILDRSTRTITAAEGQIVKVSPWGRRRLAYPIHKFTDGIYHLFVLESESSLSELDRRMKNVDRVLRHVIVRTDLEHKRAEKLAKRNPKKERVRPAAPAPAAAAAAPELESAMIAAADETAPQA